MMHDASKNTSQQKIRDKTPTQLSKQTSNAEQSPIVHFKPQMVKYLLVFDPDSHQVYTLNLSDNTIHIEVEVPEQYRLKAEDDLKKVQDLIQLPNSKYNIVTQGSQRYRRRQISDYLLHKMINPLPTYLAQSPMSDAFSKVSTLKFYIDISDYLYVENSPELNPLTIDLDIDLVTCADEVIKKILREVHNIFKVKLKPKNEENQFILKVAGFREYLSGNYPMLCYDRVRANLRGIQYIQVVLTEISKNNKVHDLFPAIFERDLKDIKAGYFSPVPWQKFIGAPIFFYYAPYPLPRFQPPKIAQVQQNQYRESVFTQNPGGRTSTSFQPVVFGQNMITGRQNIQEVNDIQIEPQCKPDGSDYVRLRPRFFMKEKESEFNLYRQKQIERKIIQIENSVLYSGECDWPFKIRVVGITDITRLLLLDDKDADFFKKFQMRRATYNGLCGPQFLTKKSAKQEEAHNTAKKKVEDQNLNIKKTPILQFQIEKKPNLHQKEFEFIKDGYFTPHFFSHGNQGTTIMEFIQKLYELDVQPYVIQLELILMYGQKQLTPFSIGKTSKKPFRMTVNWNEEIEFQGLKISQLPMEVRLCINIIIFNAGGEEQIIGCCMIDVFDDLGKFRSGRTVTNIWPFYKVDKRLACMSSYNGRGLIQLDQNPIKPIPRKNLINQSPGDYYSKLIIATEVFEFPVYWSLRNEKIMEALGFPQKFKNKRQINASNPQEIIDTENDNGLKKQTTQLKDNLRLDDWRQTPKIEEIAKLEELLKVDPLNRDSFTKQDKYILIKCRNHYKSLPYALAIFLCAIDWSDPEQVREVYRMIKIWKPLPPGEALPLLDANFSDEMVRFYAAQRVANQKDDELVLYMLELTQALMFEQSHFSPLGEMLIERSIMNPWLVGHEFFWQLRYFSNNLYFRSQLHIQPSYERYSLLLEQLLMLCGKYRDELLDEVLVNDEIMYIAEHIKTFKDSRLQKSDMEEGLMRVRAKFKSVFLFAIDARMSAKDFTLEKCKILDSKKLPLWLEMVASEGREKKTPSQIELIQKVLTKDIQDFQSRYNKLKENILDQKSNLKLIFKCGDDIRQDLLTLQLIKIMDKIWLDYGYDFRMKPYRVISTLDQVGMIEVVLDSDTVSGIHHDQGSLGALSKSSIMEYLTKYNKTKPKLDNAVENFLRSCAGYCVATFMLGIGDRHSGNIMLTKMGHLFHIDFGHFLGNFKTKFGVKRERAPFVFTEEMAYVMGGVTGDKYKQFENFSTDAYNLIRRFGNLLINIFLMMLSAGMPELQNKSDVEYLEDQLSLDLGDQEATEKFRKAIIQSLNDQWRKIDNFIHNLKRK